MHTRPSQALLALLDAADGVHRLGAPAVVIAFGTDGITVQGSDRYGSHRDLNEWIQGGHAQMGLVHQRQALLDAAHAFQASVRVHPHLAELLGTGRLDILWTGQGRAMVWVLPGSIDTTIRHSSWPQRANTTKVLAGLRRAERIGAGQTEDITLFHPYAMTPEAQAHTHPGAIAALAPLVGNFHSQGRAYVLGHNRSTHAADRFDKRKAGLLQGKVDRTTRAAFTTLLGAMHGAPAAVAHAVLEKQDDGALTVHTQTGGIRTVWEVGPTPHPDAAMASWIGPLLRAWTDFWAHIDVRNPGISHHATTPARLSLLRDGEREDVWLDLFGGCRIDQPTDLGALLRLRTGPTRAVALRDQHPYLAVPACSQHEAIALALAMASVQWRTDQQVTVWDLF
jgi:hypothetical protein